MLVGLMLLLTTFAGCAVFKRPIVHPLENDFCLLKEGEPFNAPKNGAFMSDFYMQEVMGIDIEKPEVKNG